jgi:repressor LexA
MEGLTARQQEVLDIIRNFIGLNGYPPTIRELGEVLKMGPRAVHDHLKALERKGHIEREEGLPRAISFPDKMKPRGTISNRVTLSGEFVELPVLGRIAAGAPLLAQENYDETMVVDRSLTTGGGDFLLRVIGDSMIDDHIVEGDLVIVRPQSVADPGSIVAALIGNDATVKRYLVRDGKPLLRPANENYDDIKLNEDASIIGLVVGVIRRFH